MAVGGNMQFEKFNVVDLTISAGLLIVAILAIIYGFENLATNIAVGLVGYLGGKVTKATIKEGGEK